jgi:hypothetical protein
LLALWQGSVPHLVPSEFAELGVAADLFNIALFQKGHTQSKKIETGEMGSPETNGVFCRRAAQFIEKFQ